jgi:hypothetical protein
MVRIPTLIAVAVAATGGVTAGDLLDATTHVSLGASISVGFAVASAVWWFGRKFQQIEDRDIAVKAALQLKGELDKQHFESIEHRLNHLPCEREDCIRAEKKASHSD